MRILIVDDHIVLRAGMMEIIRAEYGKAEIGQAGTAKEAMELVHNEEWDAIVFDIGLPDRDGLEVLKEIRGLHPKLPILVLSGHPEDEYAVRIIKAGASGYVMKGSSVADIGSALQKVMAGGFYASPSLSDRIMGNLGVDQSKLPHERLSDREYMILLMIGNGKPVGEIAKQLKLSVKTISTYRMRLLEKMDLKSTAELMNYAVRNKLVD